ncbi:MAG: glycosyltransferase [Rhodoferax sp.]|uniref:glycosyltransferase family 4 protein n=1 Tax=Rhodoferax sp. TaxID=50421 RepID=UPI002ACDC4E0|nr:glycosyltransferase [Rhodoferax sp.]MDZ7891012.1 glycosyltransferase [Rhodoferax sp.]
MKKSFSKIFTWQPVLTDHQAFTHHELALQSDASMLAYVSRFEDSTRQAQGWVDTSVMSVPRALIPAASFLRSSLRVLWKNREHVHFFGSVFEDPRLYFLMWTATLMGITCYLISEPYSPVALGYFGDRSIVRERVKAKLRPFLYRVYVLTLRKRICGVFAMSQLAVQQYAEAGMPREKIFPFGYFVPALVPSTEAAQSVRRSAQLRLVFVGSLISRKGLDTLIEAVYMGVARGADIQLDIFGPGDPRLFDIDEKNVCYRGLIPFGQTQQYLPGYDFLVLPSQYDGWGVVVNEALCAGVPAICSDQVGARVLVETFGAGKLFARGDATALSALFVLLAQNSDMQQACKAACPAAAEAIQPSRAAAYMLKVMLANIDERSHIKSPWYGGMNDQRT